MTRYKKFIYALTAILFLASVTSCDDYLDVNTDPNNPTEVSPDLVLPVGQAYTAFYMHGDRRVNHLGNMFMYNWSESYGFSWYDAEFQYQVTTTFYATLFDQAYTRAIKQYNVLTNLDGTQYNNYIAIGKIMKAYHFQLLVDLYGDIPYFEASARSLNPTPVYDPAEDVYNDLFVQLTDAIGLIKAAAEDVAAIEVGADDVMFQGDMDNWIRFANTLKLRMLTRMSGKTAAAERVDKINAELDVIETEGTGYITSDVIVNPGYVKEVNKQNPFWDSFGKGADDSETLNFRATCASQYILDYLEATLDPRIDRLYEEPATGHLGVDQGLEPGEEFGYQFVSNIGPGLLKDPTMGSNIFSLSEQYFNAAELALKGFGGDPEALYYAGIEASFNYLEIEGSYASYTSNALDNVSYAASANKLQAIITQKWIALNGITAEQSWFDYTRTGYPAGLPVSEQATTNDRPVRLFYPASERSSNALNVPAQPNAFTTKLFWAN